MSEQNSCIFCSIISGKISAPRVYEDSQFICIRDIHPQAKTHLLVIPKQHVASLDEAFPQHSSTQVQMLGSLFEVATRIARQEGLLPGGFRSVINTGAQGGQTVFHLHLHLLGGEVLRETFG